MSVEPDSQTGKRSSLTPSTKKDKPDSAEPAAKGADTAVSESPVAAGEAGVAKQPEDSKDTPKDTKKKVPRVRAPHAHGLFQATFLSLFSFFNICSIFFFASLKWHIKIFKIRGNGGINTPGDRIQEQTLRRKHATQN